MPKRIWRRGDASRLTWTRPTMRKIGVTVASGVWPHVQTQKSLNQSVSSPPRQSLKRWRREKRRKRGQRHCWTPQRLLLQKCGFILCSQYFCTRSTNNPARFSKKSILHFKETDQSCFRPAQQCFGKTQWLSKKRKAVESVWNLRIYLT